MMAPQEDLEKFECYGMCFIYLFIYLWLFPSLEWIFLLRCPSLDFPVYFVLMPIQASD